MELGTRGPRYAAARITAEKVQPRFARLGGGRAIPDVDEIEFLLDAAFWASLRREESYITKISMAFLPPEEAGASLQFERSLNITPETLGKLSPAAERPGIHLAVWREGGELKVWGATRAIPPFCFVLEIVAPGLVVLKHRRADATAKFINVAVLEGDQIKVLDAEAPALPGCPNLVSALLGCDGFETPVSASVLVELAVSMRSHQRGGTLLVVPSKHERWRDSIRHPIQYAVGPKFASLAELIAHEPSEQARPSWQEAFDRTIEAIAGLTAVDGATIITDRFEVLAFGAKISRLDGSPSLDNVLLTEPVEGAIPQVVSTLQTGGTRHLSAAQFAHDQPDAMAMVASQDGRFTVFAWSECDTIVRAHRVETLLI
jgi:hypothetical protein